MLRSLIGASVLLVAAGCAPSGSANSMPGVAAGLTTVADPGAALTPLDPLGDGTFPPIALPAASLDIVPAPALARARYHHAAALTRAPDGTLLLVVTGGEDGAGGALAHAERYDVARGTWTEAGLNGRPIARTRHSATALNDGTGRILLAGGHTGGNGPAMATAEIYDPARDEFRLITNLSVPRTGHTATLLPDGRVLIAGGHTAGGESLDTCEVFHPNDESFRTAPARLTVRRAHHAATLLPDGRVLLSGGLQSNRHSAIQVNDSADLWQGTSDIRSAALMSAPRAEHTATLLPNGLVLLAGGSTHSPTPRARNDAELFDPASALGQFAPVSAVMVTARSGHTATLVPGSNVVLLIGGATEPHPELCPVTVGIERFIPDALGVAPEAAFQGVTETAMFVQPLGFDGAPIGLPETAQGLTAHTAIALPGGQVLVAGGADCAFARPVAVPRTALATDGSLQH